MKYILIFNLILFCNNIMCQKISLDKKRGKEPFELTIKSVQYKKIINNYVMNHVEYKKWQIEKKDSCKNINMYSTKISLLVSINYKGKVFVTNHYSSPSLTEWVEDIELEKKVEKIAKGLEKLIKKHGNVKPPINDYSKKYMNDEVVVENIWEYKCK